MSSLAQATCADQYFAPDDNDNTRPLGRPHKEFSVLLRNANAGKAEAYRSLAASYEAGYLVSKCPEKAAHWYARAAHSGDEIARRWLAEREAQDKLRAGPECVGLYCSENGKGQSHVAMFYAGPNGHYFAPLTINGVTVTGMIDTGASSIAMSSETAAKLGIDKLIGVSGVSVTANGTVNVTRVVVPEVTVSGITLNDVRVAIGITGQTLIGMTFLSRLRVSMNEGTLTMSR